MVLSRAYECFRRRWAKLLLVDVSTDPDVGNTGNPLYATVKLFPVKYRAMFVIRDVGARRHSKNESFLRHPQCEIEGFVDSIRRKVLQDFHDNDCGECPEIRRVEEVHRVKDNVLNPRLHRLLVCPCDGTRVRVDTDDAPVRILLGGAEFKRTVSAAEREDAIAEETIEDGFEATLLQVTKRPGATRNPVQSFFLMSSTDINQS